MVSNGDTLWIYSPADREAERYKLNSKMAGAFAGLMAAFNFQDVERLFRFTVERDDNQYRVALIPKRRSESRMFKRMDLVVGSSQKLRSAAWTSPDGGKTEMVFSDERPAGFVTFEFQPPAGVKVTAPPVR